MTDSAELLLLAEEMVRIPLPLGWRAQRLSDCAARLDCGIPGAEITLAVACFRDAEALRTGDLTAYLPEEISRGFAGERWQPREDDLIVVVRDYRGRGPHLLLVDAQFFGRDRLYRLCASIPLRSATATTAALAVVEPVPTFLKELFPRIEAGRPAVTPPPQPLTGRETLFELHGFDLSLPEHWASFPREPAPQGQGYLFEDARDRDRASLWLDVQTFHVPDVPEPAALVEAVARRLLGKQKDAPSRQEPDRRPWGRAELRRLSASEGLAAAGRSDLDQGEMVDQEYGARVCLEGAYMGVVHWHLVYPQELRYDPAFQALAGRLWQGFLEGRLRPDRQG